MSLPKPYYDDPKAGITIYHGDCREILPLLVAERGRFDLLLTDPPFDFGHYATDTAPAIPLIMTAAPRAALWGYPELLVEWCISLGRAPDEWVTWWPSNAAAKAGGRHKDIPRQIECVAVFSHVLNAAGVTQPRACSKLLGEELSETVRAPDVWQDPSPGIGFNARQRRHPNEKPVSVMSKLLTLCGTDARTVIDPYMGSGPVAKACKDRGLQYVGIELVEKYCEVAVNRLRQEVLPGAAIEVMS